MDSTGIAQTQTQTHTDTDLVCVVQTEHHERIDERANVDAITSCGSGYPKTITIRDISVSPLPLVLTEPINARFEFITSQTITGFITVCIVPGGGNSW